MAPQPYSLEIEGVSLVLAGNFNPAIFQPAWLATAGLVSATEAEKADIEVITPQVSQFRVGPYSLVVDLEHFQLSTDDVSASSSLRDLALGTFRILKHTPVRAMGINRGMHFKMSSAETWHAVGHALVSKAPWQEYLTNPGTRSVIVEGGRADSPAKYVRVTVQPSALAVPGVFIASNEHFVASSSDALSTFLVDLQSQWEAAQRFARQCAEGILAKTTSNP